VPHGAGSERGGFRRRPLPGSRPAGQAAARAAPGARQPRMSPRKAARICRLIQSDPPVPARFVPRQELETSFQRFPPPSAPALVGRQRFAPQSVGNLVSIAWGSRACPAQLTLRAAEGKSRLPLERRGEIKVDFGTGKEAIQR